MRNSTCEAAGVKFTPEDTARRWCPNVSNMPQCEGGQRQDEHKALNVNELFHYHSGMFNFVAGILTATTKP